MNIAKNIVSNFIKTSDNYSSPTYIPSWKKDIGLASRLLDHLSEDEIYKLFKIFFENDRKSYTFSWFYTIINDLRTEATRVAPSKKSFKNVDSWRYE